ncbi:MAG: NAD(P)-binding domain-containing protein, partial [Campylobacteraceae bacterium]
TLNYRKSTFTRLNIKHEEDLFAKQKEGKVELLLGVDIAQLENENGDVKVKFTDDTIRVFNRIIYAIGGTTPVDFLKKCGIEVSDKKLPKYDENLETNVKGMFVCGDLATASGGSIALALNDAYKIVNFVINNKK